MSKDWIIVWEGEQLVTEIPFEGIPSQALTTAAQKYPPPTYSCEYVSSSVPTATGVELTKGWDHEGFDEHDARAKAGRVPADTEQ